MPSLPEGLLFGLLAVLLTLPLVWYGRFIARYRRPREPPPAGPDAPRVAVLLPLRGADPFLTTCLAGLLDQDYPRYCVRIVVDSADDPAWAMVRSAVAAARAKN